MSPEVGRSSTSSLRILQFAVWKKGCENGGPCRRNPGLHFKSQRRNLSCTTFFFLNLRVFFGQLDFQVGISRPRPTTQVLRSNPQWFTVRRYAVWRGAFWGTATGSTPGAHWAPLLRAGNHERSRPIDHMITQDVVDVSNCLLLRFFLCFFVLFVCRCWMFSDLHCISNQLRRTLFRAWCDAYQLQIRNRVGGTESCQRFLKALRRDGLGYTDKLKICLYIAFCNFGTKKRDTNWAIFGSDFLENSVEGASPVSPPSEGFAVQSLKAFRCAVFHFQMKRFNLHSQVDSKAPTKCGSLRATNGCVVYSSSVR